LRFVEKYKMGRTVRGFHLKGLTGIWASIFLLLSCGGDDSINPKTVIKLEGNIIAFVSKRDGIKGSEIYLMNENGTGQINITNSDSNDVHLVWSPDGNKIAFVSYRERIPDIYIMDSDGSNQSKLVSTDDYDYLQRWSPDGTKIVFSPGHLMV